MTKLYTDKLIPAIELAEDFRPIVYADSLGYPTIGIGHRLPFPVDVSIAATGFTPPLTLDQAHQLLTSDLLEASKVAALLFPQIPTHSVRTDVLIELAFILGGGNSGLPSWRKLLKAVRKGSPAEVAWEILNSRAYWQIPERLLTLAQRYLTRRY